MQSKEVFFAGASAIPDALEPLLAREKASLRRFTTLSALQQALAADRPAALLLGGRIEGHAAAAVFPALSRRPRTLLVLGPRQVPLREELLRGGAIDVFFSPLRPRQLARRLLELTGTPVPRPTTSLNVPVHVELSGRTLEGRSVDVSLLAAHLQLPEPVAPRSLLLVRFALPDGRALSLFANVLSCRPLQDRALVAVRFLALTREEEAALAALARVPASPGTDELPSLALEATPPPHRPLTEATLFDDASATDVEEDPADRQAVEELSAALTADALVAASEEVTRRERRDLGGLRRSGNGSILWPSALPPLPRAVELLERTVREALAADDDAHTSQLAARLVAELSDAEREALAPPPSGDAALHPVLRALLRHGAGQRLRALVIEEQARTLHLASDAPSFELAEGELTTFFAEADEWLAHLKSALPRLDGSGAAELQAVESKVSAQVAAIRALADRMRAPQAKEQPQKVAPPMLVPAPLDPPRRRVSPAAIVLGLVVALSLACNGYLLVRLHRASPLPSGAVLQLAADRSKLGVLAHSEPGATAAAAPADSLELCAPASEGGARSCVQVVLQ